MLEVHREKEKARQFFGLRATFVLGVAFLTLEINRVF